MSDLRLVFIHAPADLATFFGCVLIAITAAYIYRRGKFRGSQIVYPGLWTSGAAFMFCFGVARVLAALEMILGGFNWLVGGAKLGTAICCLWFAQQLWKAKDDIAQIGQILHAVSRNKGENKDA